MKWSLNTYQTCQEWELGRILDTAAATGYHGVELLMDYKQQARIRVGHAKSGLGWTQGTGRRKRRCYFLTHELPEFPLRKRR